MQDQEDKHKLQLCYWVKNREVKRKDNRNLIQELTQEAEAALDQGNMERLHEITRTLSGENSKPSRSVKDKNGNTVSGQEDHKGI